MNGITLLPFCANCIEEEKKIYFIQFTSHESNPPFFQPAQMNMWGICSMYPAFLYITSHIVLLITGTATSCRVDGNGPSEN